MAIATIKQRFNQPGYAVYKNLEALLVKAANNEDYSSYFKEVTLFYQDDIKPSELDVQLQNISTHFSGNSGSVALSDCLDYLRSLSIAQQSFYSEVCNIASLILAMPATNAISERCFSVMRRVKTYLRSTMTQARLNHMMFLNINKERLDSLDMDAIANEFVRGSEHRLRIFGKFK